MLRSAAAVVALLALGLGSPAAARAHHGDERAAVLLEGTFQLSHSDDFRGGKARFYASVVQGQRRVQLDLAGRRAGPRTGDRIRVVGSLRRNRVRVRQLTTLAPAGTRSLAVASGHRRVAVVLVNFADDPSQPFTPAQAAATMFESPESVASYFDEASFGATTMSGDVLGWYTLPSPSSGCSIDQWAREADAAAAADGVAVAGYQHVVYAFPRASSCGWAGLAEMPGRRSWINGSFHLKVVAHELTHNLGTHHAGALTCSSGATRVPLSSSCTGNEYGDPFDVMGSGSRHAASWRKGQLGWLSPSAMATVAGPGTYTLAPQEWLSPSVQSLRVPRGSNGQYLYLEFRQPYGSHDDFAPGDPAVNGVTVRLGPDYRWRQPSYLIDTTASTASFGDAALGVGKSLSDPTSGVTIRTVSVTPAGASVEITFGGSPAPPPAPPAPAPSTPPPDTTPPAAPATLAGSLQAGPSVALSWAATGDNVGVTGYRVLRDGNELASASGTSFTDVTPPPGRPVSYAVRAVDGAGNLGPPSAPVTISVPAPPARPSVLTSPSVVGSLARGSVLTARPGTWAGTAPLRFSYRWQRCTRTGQRCVSVAGATRATYRAGAADVGRTIRVVVRVSNPHGSASAASALTARVARKALRTRRT